MGTEKAGFAAESLGETPSGNAAEPSEIAALLAAVNRGDRNAMDRLVPLVYEQLRRLAHRELRRERPNHTLSTRALVNEAWLKLAGLNQIEFRDRAHFFGVAAGAMRRILIDYANRHRAAKRGGSLPRSELLDPIAIAVEQRGEALLALDKALSRLRLLNERQSAIVEWRFFGGMSIEQTAAALYISISTVKREWMVARAWLNRELSR
jgi:RNA polymerase sigma factor (TIGR02999 family)